MWEKKRRLRMWASPGNDRQRIGRRSPARYLLNHRSRPRGLGQPRASESAGSMARTDRQGTTGSFECRGTSHHSRAKCAAIVGDAPSSLARLGGHHTPAAVEPLDPCPPESGCKESSFRPDARGLEEQVQSHRSILAVAAEARRGRREFATVRPCAPAYDVCPRTTFDVPRRVAVAHGVVA